MGGVNVFLCCAGAHHHEGERCGFLSSYKSAYLLKRFSGLKRGEEAD
jgi:hypothetical protein